MPIIERIRIADIKRHRRLKRLAIERIHSNFTCWILRDLRGGALAFMANEAAEQTRRGAPRPLKA
ncbi:MAG: hypothetical protein O3B01_14665 [Planctomycetota bacterium]|nr:hypothetical protein [Planctomycetota bacterium]MDA1139815.1 hypothetical protein [Planctomycetota bacterium]